MARVRLWAAFLLTAGILSGCLPGDDLEKPRLSMFVGVDISGSFMRSEHYDDAIDFLAQYLYAHLHGLGGLEVPSSLFVSSIGGASADQPKTFYPKQMFENETPEEIAQKLRSIFPRGTENPFTDYNAFFEQIALTVRNKKLILRPISIVMVSDGVPDIRKDGKTDYRSIHLKSLEGLSRNITLRLLYTDAEVGRNWQTKVPRKRVKIWTQDAPVMVSWKDPKIFAEGKPLDEQKRFFSWVAEIVDYGVSARRVD
jgi:hypothetical protein